MSDWRPKLIASDMDGTLLHWDDTVGEETLAELARWRADGVPLSERRPRLLQALNRLYGPGPDGSANNRSDPLTSTGLVSDQVQ